jgi:hypothetical protein
MNQIVRKNYTVTLISNNCSLLITKSIDCSIQYRLLKTYTKILRLTLFPLLGMAVLEPCLHMDRQAREKRSPLADWNSLLRKL